MLAKVVSSYRPVRLTRAGITSLLSQLHADPKENEGSTVSNKQMIMRLRRKTGFPILKCKQALAENKFDFNQAVEAIKAQALKEGWEKMESLSERVVRQGLVTAYQENNRAALIEINCESDFVAKTSDFQSLVASIARAVLHRCSGPSVKRINLSPNELLKLIVPGKNQPVQDLLASAIGKLKENIKISRGVVVSADHNDNELIGMYTHPEMGTPRKGGKLPLMGRYAALVVVKSTALEPQGPGWSLAMGRDIAQHVVGMNPKIIGNSGNGHAKSTKKDEAVESEHHEDDEELVPGESHEFIEDSDELLKQPFLLDANITVQNWLDINQLTVKDFVRFQVGGSHNEENDDV